MSLQQSQFSKVKHMLMRGYSIRAVAEHYNLGETTVRRINRSNSFDNYHEINKRDHQKKVVTDSRKSKWKFWTWAS